MTLRMESSLSARKALDALLSTPTPVAVPVAVQSPAPTPAVAAATERPKVRTASPPATSAPAPASESNAPTIQRQQQAGGDAIAQAQNLWNSGSRDAAIDLVQQSIAAAERSAKTGSPTASSNTVLVPLVREMASMQLAESRFGAVWEMLTRLEPLLGNQADLWAIRANAAQRLGRHQDSVHAYMMALQTRPDEQRWLLGTAVSLAALGQTSSAAEMAEKARALGPVSKDILAYLRQNGVPLRDQ
jgi:tetratricopeptide (TPR) repeat protein